MRDDVVTPFHRVNRSFKSGRLWVIAGCGLLVGLSTVGVPTSGAAPTVAALGRSTSRLSPVLRDGTSVPPRAIVRLTMLTPKRGVGLAVIPPSADEVGRYYLAHTDDGGDTWIVSGTFPRPLMPYGRQSFMAFASPTEGYMVLAGRRTYTEFTDNGGETWSVVKVPGQPTDLSIAGGSLWIIADQCPRGTTNDSLCPTDLARYVVGARTPSVVFRVPVQGPALSDRVRPRAAEATLWSRRGDEGIVSEGIEGRDTTILVTLNAGRHWTVIPDPCLKLQVAGIVALSASHLVLFCNLDLGMHQGINQLWTTTDNGQDWALTAQGSVEEPSQDIGNIGAGMGNDLTASGNESLLWILGEVDGLSYSADGGSTWGGAPLETEGDPSQIVVIGATEAWLPLPGIGLYRTLNGTEWAELP